MAADVEIKFRADGKQAQSEISKLRGEFKTLGVTLTQTKQASGGVRAAVQAIGPATQKTSSSLRKLSSEARTASRELSNLQAKSETHVRGQHSIRTAFKGSAGGALGLLRALNPVSAILGGLSGKAKSMASILNELASESLKSAATMEKLRIGVTKVEGSSAAAEKRLQQLENIARLPGANLEKLVQFSNRMKAMGISSKETDTILRSVGQTVVVLGGSAHTAEQALEQITQALQKNTVVLQDFRPILQRIPGFLQAVADVHGVPATMDGMRAAVKRLGGSVKDALIPVLLELEKRFGTPPAKSYVRSIDELNNAFFQFKATIGEKFLPVVAESARSLASFLDGMRSLMQGTEETTQAQNAFVQSLAGIDKAERTSALQERITLLIREETELKKQQAELKRSSEAYEKLAQKLLKVRSEMDQWNAIMAGSTDALAPLQADLKTLHAELDQLNKVINQTEGRRSTAGLAHAQRRASDIEKQIKATEGLIASAQNHIDVIHARKAATEEATKATDTGTQATKKSTDTVKRSGEEWSAVRIAQELWGQRHDTILADASTASESWLKNAQENAREYRDLTTDMGDALGEFSNKITEAERKALGFSQTLQATQTPPGLFSVPADVQKQIDQQFNPIRAFYAPPDEWGGMPKSLKDRQDAARQAWREGMFGAAPGVSDVTVTQITEITQAITEYNEALELTSVAADKAFGRLNPAVRKTEADFRKAEAALLDFDSAFKLSLATIPRAASAFRALARPMGNTDRKFGDLSRTIQTWKGQVINTRGAVDEFNWSLERLNRTGQELSLASVSDALNIKAQPVSGAQHTGWSFANPTVRNAAITAGQDFVNAGITAFADFKRISEQNYENLEELAKAHADRILEINAEKARKLAAIDTQIKDAAVRRLVAIKQAFDDAKNAEIAARQQAADQILAIEKQYDAERKALREQQTQRLIDMEKRTNEEIDRLNHNFLERERQREEQRLSIATQAAEAREAVQQRYAANVQNIYNQLVLDVQAVWERVWAEVDSLMEGYFQREEQRTAELTRLTEQHGLAREQAHKAYALQMEDIYRNMVDAWDALEDGFTERQEDRAAQRTKIEENAASLRTKANQQYADTVGSIATNLVDTIEGIWDEIVQIEEDAAEKREQIQKETKKRLAEADQRYRDTRKQIEADAQADAKKVFSDAAAAREKSYADKVKADRDYAKTYQDIQNNLVDKVLGIQEDMNSKLQDLGDQRLDAEADRLKKLEYLHEDHQKKLEALERKRNETIADVTRKYHQDISDIGVDRDRKATDIQQDTSLTEEQRLEKLEALRTEINRRREDLDRAYQRRLLELEIKTQRSREDIERASGEKRIAIAEQTAEKLSEIEGRAGEVETAGQKKIAGAEETAGVTFETAQKNYVPALSQHEAALLKHADALLKVDEKLKEIDRTETTGIQTIIDGLRELLIQAGIDWATERKTIQDEGDAAKQAVTDKEKADVKAKTDEIDDVEKKAGMTYEEALKIYVPAVDLNTKALNDLNKTLKSIDKDESDALKKVDDAETDDREATDKKQKKLEEDAGVDIQTARDKYVPALNAATKAMVTLTETLTTLDKTLSTETKRVKDTGKDDFTQLGKDIEKVIKGGVHEQINLEGLAGTTFKQAFKNFIPAPSAMDKAASDRDADITAINEQEIAEIEATNTAAIKDRLDTDAQITQRRDDYLKARDLEIFKFNQKLLASYEQEILEIQAIKENLNVDLKSIDEKLSAELTTIRENKVAFDAKMNELITAVNEWGNKQVNDVNIDTAAMREHLKVLAEEARNNAWKTTIASTAKLHLTLTGLLVGTALGNPAAGLAVGQGVGGVAEHGINELFHFEQTDAIARRMARRAAHRHSRPAPNYLPTPTQLQNAKDLGREVIAGFTEGMQQRGTPSTPFGSTGNPDMGFQQEIHATLQIQFPDGTVQEIRNQVIRLQQQGRIL